MAQTNSLAANRKILVTGSTGKVGKRLIPLLWRRGATVRAANRRPLPARAGLEPVRFDWTDQSTYAAARAGVDAMYLVPGSIAEDSHADRIEILLDGAADAGVKRVVLLSVYGVGQAPPESRLRRIEHAVEVSGVPYTIVRPGAFMQNFSDGLRWRESLANAIRERDEIVSPGGDGLVSYVSAEDIASVVAIALTEEGHAGKAYSPLGPEPLTLAQVADLISWVAGRRIRYIETDRGPIRDALVAAGASRETAEHSSELYTHSVSSGFLGALNDDVLSVTGRAPVSFAEFAVGAAAAWQRQDG